MFQRIQSIFLILAVALILGSYFLSVGSVGETALWTYGVKVDGQFTDTVNTYFYHLPLAIIAILLGVSLFQYKNRARQMALLRGTFILYTVTFVLMAMYFNDAQAVLNGSYAPGIGLFLPFGALFLTWFALRSVRKDDELVKSVDRIR